MTVNELISILKTLTGKEVLVYFLKFADKIINISNENENISLYVLPKGVIKRSFGTNDLFYKAENAYFVEATKEIGGYETIIPNKENIFTESEIEEYENKLLENILFKRIDRLKKEQEEQIKYYKEKYDECLRTLKSYRRSYEESLLTQINENDLKKMKQNAVDEIKAIKNHPKVKDIEFKNECLFITIEDIKCTEPFSDRVFLLGDVGMQIYLGDANGQIVSFYEVEKSKTARGYWGEGQVHPHVNCWGEACFGNTDAQLAQYLSEREYYATFLTALNFLQTCNIEDVAGYGVCKWDELLPDGSIREGHKPEQGEYGEENGYSAYYAEYTCEICGCAINEDEHYICNDCGRIICEACVTNIRDDIYVCNECIEENYERCNICDEYVRVDQAVEVEGEIICDECHDEHTVTCDRCGIDIFEENARYIESGDDEGTYCQDCYEEIEEEMR